MNKLPATFRNVCITDKRIRSNIKSEHDLRQWVEEYSVLTKTNWVVRGCNKRSNRFVVRIVYLCHRTSYRRVDPKDNKRGRSKNCGCPAEIRLKIKLTTKDTMKKDAYVKDGLPGLIEFKYEHNHCESSERLSYLWPTRNIKEVFEEYFKDGLGPTEAINLHVSKLKLEEGENSAAIACTSLNPRRQVVYGWHKKWRAEPTVNQATNTQEREQIIIKEEPDVLEPIKQEIEYEDPLAEETSLAISEQIVKEEQNLQESINQDIEYDDPFANLSVRAIKYQDVVKIDAGEFEDIDAYFSNSCRLLTSEQETLAKNLIRTVLHLARNKKLTVNSRVIC